MNVTDDFVKKIEVKYLRLIAELLRSGKTNVARAKESARLFRSYLPFKTSDEMIHKLSNLKEIYPELVPVYIFLQHELENLSTQDVLSKMRDLMKDEKIDDALKVANTD